MRVCRVCGEELPNERFAVTKRKLKNGETAEYLDSTCMVCRRTKYLRKPGKREIHRAGTKRWRESNPGQFREQSIRKYGITQKDYDNLREEQNNSCAICGVHETNAPQGKAVKPEWSLHIDHNHITGQVRSLLCHNCNLLIGHAKEDNKILQLAAEYLTKWKQS
jgi:hypothetical protein